VLRSGCLVPKSLSPAATLCPVELAAWKGKKPTQPCWFRVFWVASFQIMS